MFQYAVARLAAERLACPLLIEEPPFEPVSRADWLRPRPSYEIFDLFPRLRRGKYDVAFSFCRRIAPKTTERILTRIAPNSFQPTPADGNEREGFEGFDPNYFSIGKGTRLSGYYQSAKYFAGNEERVRRWYALDARLVKAAEDTFQAARLEPESTVAVHVRLGDYRRQTHIIGHPTEGWLLSRDYYKRALDALPEGYRLALFSDEPQSAVEFIGRTPAFLSSGTNRNLDFAMMLRCRYIIIANSTFSWWAGWLAGADAKVIAPRYFLGWRRGEWFPPEIMVPTWQYV